MALRARAHVEVMLAHKVEKEEVCSTVMLMLEEFVGRLCLYTYLCVCQGTVCIRVCVCVGHVYIRLCVCVCVCVYSLSLSLSLSLARSALSLSLSLSYTHMCM